MVQTADGSPEEGAGRKDDDMSNPMWVHILRLLDDEEQATMVHQIFKQAMITRAIETDLSDRDRAQHVRRTSDLVAAELAELDSLTGVTDLQRRQQLLLATRVVINNAVSATLSEHARKVREAHEKSSARHLDGIAVRDAETERLSLQLEAVRDASDQVASLQSVRRE